jgi:hypothetical protein
MEFRGIPIISEAITTLIPSPKQDIKEEKKGLAI